MSANLSANCSTAPPAPCPRAPPTKAAPAPAPRPAPRRPAAAPGTPHEAALAGIWATVLRTAADAVDVHTPFLELGGSSLAALKVTSLARGARGFSFALRDLFSRDGTVHRLAATGGHEEGGSA